VAELAGDVDDAAPFGQEPAREAVRGTRHFPARPRYDSPPRCDSARRRLFSCFHNRRSAGLIKDPPLFACLGKERCVSTRLTDPPGTQQTCERRDHGGVIWRLTDYQLTRRRERRFSTCTAARGPPVMGRGCTAGATVSLPTQADVGRLWPRVTARVLVDALRHPAACDAAGQCRVQRTTRLGSRRRGACRRFFARMPSGSSGRRRASRFGCRRMRSSQAIRPPALHVGRPPSSGVALTTSLRRRTTSTHSSGTKPHGWRTRSCVEHATRAGSRTVTWVRSLGSARTGV